MSSSASSVPAASCVQILRTSSVQPLHPTKRFNFYLAPADTFYIGAGYMRDILFYRLGDNSACSNMVEILTQGLSMALVDFYPVAGRLVLHDTDGGDLTIDCNDAGVELIEALVCHNFSELEEKSFPIHDFYDDLVIRSAHNVTGLPQDAPLLSIQVSRFQDGGGIAIGIAASHVVFDGYSIWYFLNAWGQCCRGQGVALPPFHVRAVINPECWLDKSKIPKENLPSVDIAIPVRRPPITVYNKVMHFDSISVQQLKQTAVQESGNTRISSFQAVMACVWKRMIAARGLAPDQKVCMRVTADIRQRLRPSLTAAYFGNAVVSLRVDATASDVMNESIGAVAARINRALKVLDDQSYIRERLGACRKTEFCKTMEEAIRGSTHFLFMVQGPKSPVYDVDLGVAGKPRAVRPPKFRYDDTVMVYPSREGGGGMDVCVGLSSMQQLHAFLSFASPNCIDI